MGVQVTTQVPMPKTFIFENYWLQHESFYSVFQEVWSQSLYQLDPTNKLMAKFERARKVLKQWHRNLPIISSSIENIKLIIQFLDIVEEMRDLTLQEWNFHNILIQNLQALLEQQKHIRNKEGISSGALWGMQARNYFMSTPQLDTSIILLQHCTTRLEMWL
jgi:hypothetical protein